MMHLGDQTLHFKYSVEKLDGSKIASSRTFGANGIRVRVVQMLKNLWFFFKSFLGRKNGVVNVIVVSGKGFTEKETIRAFHDNNYLKCDSKQLCFSLSLLMTKYFEKLVSIGRFVYARENLGKWQPERVTVITHWGGSGPSGVGKREEVLAKAVNYINDEWFKQWEIVASSSTRKEAFPKGFNPFGNNGAAKLPTTDICEILVEKLPLMDDIDWKDVENATDEMTLKKQYDKLMLKLNH